MAAKLSDVIECCGDHAQAPVGLPNDVEVRHHAGRVVLEDVAVIHPAAGPVVGIQAIRTVALGGTLMTSSMDRQAGFFR